MNESDPGSRRGFLRTALGTAFSGAALTAHSQSPEAKPEGPETAQVGRVTLDHDVYESGGVLNGEIHFVRFPALAAARRLGGLPRHQLGQLSGWVLRPAARGRDRRDDCRARRRAFERPGQQRPFLCGANGRGCLCDLYQPP